jgi:hypothetical protein
MNRLILSAALLLFPAARSEAGGGLVLQDDACILWIDFYSVHLTAYQPESSGNEQFCRELPDTGKTIFVLDYLHQSLKEVPVDFRIIRDVTGQGRFVKLKHVEALDDIEQYTVFYQPPTVRADASLQADYNFGEEGLFVGIVTAGHPTMDTIYTAVFPIEVGASKVSLPLAMLSSLLVVPAFLLLRWYARTRRAVLRHGTRT